MPAAPATWSTWYEYDNCPFDYNVAQADGQPVWFGPRPFSAWAPGQAGADRRNLEAPAALKAGVYTLLIGLYSPQTGQRLPLAAGGDEVVVGTIAVK